MLDLALTWLPLVAIAAAFIFMGARQMTSYGKHVSEVKSINSEIIELNRKNHQIAQEQLRVLEHIKSLLEDRKS